MITETCGNCGRAVDVTGAVPGDSILCDVCGRQWPFDARSHEGSNEVMLSALEESEANETKARRLTLETRLRLPYWWILFGLSGPANHHPNAELAMIPFIIVVGVWSAAWLFLKKGWILFMCSLIPLAAAVLFRLFVYSSYFYFRSVGHYGWIGFLLLWIFIWLVGGFVTQELMLRVEAHSTPIETGRFLKMISLAVKRFAKSLLTIARRFTVKRFAKSLLSIARYHGIDQSPEKLESRTEKDEAR